MAKVVIKKDYDWKYGEPSIYPDEYEPYLLIYVDGELIDCHFSEIEILTKFGYEYKELLKRPSSSFPIKLEMK
jgi:hypothetical protein